MGGVSVTALQALAVALVCCSFSEAGSQPVVDLGYSINQATLNVGGQKPIGSSITYFMPRL